MADAKISADPLVTSLGATDSIAVLQGGVNKRANPSHIAPIQSATVTLTAADLAVLHATPFISVPAQGAGKVLVSPAGSWFLSIAINGGISPQLAVGGISQTYAAGGNAFAQTLDLSQLFPIDVDYVAAILLATGGVFSVSKADGANSAIRLFSGDDLQVPGGIATSTLNNGGSGYANGNTFTVDTGLGTLAIGTVTAQTAGVVTAYTLNTTPNGYLVGTGVATTATSGVGTGLLIDITALDYSVNPMTITVATPYSVMNV